MIRKFALVLLALVCLASCVEAGPLQNRAYKNRVAYKASVMQGSSSPSFGPSTRGNNRVRNLLSRIFHRR